ncbi:MULTISPECIES: GlxA family transcriptional regulator [unclassified Pseudomonas]|uniref:GlxA family transcriptional regulator n=1 Tax=unclassified Pseudomonas TaxID=196821 RepID=UPI0011A21FF0|nr:MULTISPECIES: GlxA family transcriptional regulator [unclassified Pseudomonas]TWC06673.1 AraC family transcriptional regulator with amidase-like domain [Pseudomonas sp. SJZ075]TWC28318.1 AraC family transcriptional regulator with amidase-like domain [Pseudomonas sp. SJZ078]TWC45418.1 AraC family transcriptional regulator with amidase-like domain [Pseudomonas sp. SJZ124]TWC80859.1 AraC family transcriptional regulator with amidase-like domain [Pseudomonas sp. SJZ101]
MPSAFESVLKNKNMAYRPLGSPGVDQAPTRVAFVLMDNFSMMSFTGAVDALVTANLMCDMPLYEILTVGVSGNQVTSDLGIVISTDIELAQLPENQDILIVAGGFRVKLQGVPLLRRKLRANAAYGAIMGGLWNGVFFVADASLLDGFECAVHPESRAMMMEVFPHVKVSSRAYVVDRGRVSCAGANSSLRMMLQLIRQTGGEALVGAIEEILRCDESGDASDLPPVFVETDPRLPESLKLALELMWQNIEEPLTIDELAACVKISKRQLERRFCSFLGATPTRYYLELRLTRARQLIQQTNRSMTEVAVATGFVSSPHFQRRFRDFFGVPPGSYRSSFGRKQTSV